VAEAAVSGILRRRPGIGRDAAGRPPRTGRVCWRVTSGQLVCTAWVDADLARRWYDDASVHQPGMEHRLEFRGGAPDPDVRDLDEEEEPS
jgi:hypothetical protein